MSWRAKTITLSTSPAPFQFRAVRLRPAPFLRLPQVSCVVASWEVRAAEEAPVPAHFGVQPAVADRTGRDGPAAIAATESFAGPDGKAVPAAGAGTRRVLAQRKVRATVEDASASGVFPALQPSAGASRTGYVACRRTAEYLYIVSAVDQLRHEFGRRTPVGKQEDLPSRPGDRDIEQATLLGVRMGLGRCQHQIKQRIVGDFGGKPVLSRTEAEDHRIVGLETL